MPDTDPSAALAGIRADLAHLRACADAIPVNPEAFDLEALMLRYARAVAAVEAVLALADDWDAEARGIFLEAARTADAGEVGAASALQSSASDLRGAITAALAPSAPSAGTGERP